VHLDKKNLYTAHHAQPVFSGLTKVFVLNAVTPEIPLFHNKTIPDTGLTNTDNTKPGGGNRPVAMPSR
jgi:hypothetical protein